MSDRSLLIIVAAYLVVLFAVVLAVTQHIDIRLPV